MTDSFQVSYGNTVKKALYDYSKHFAMGYHSSNSLRAPKPSLNNSISSSQFSYEEEVEFYSNEIIRLIKLDDFEDGEEGMVHKLFDTLCTKKIKVFQSSFQKAWLTLARNKEHEYFYSLLCAASTIQYELIKDEADCLLYAALVLNDENINDAAIRAIESWEHSEHLSILSSIRPFATSWLEDYRLEVIASLEAAHG